MAEAFDREAVARILRRAHEIESVRSSDVDDAGVVGAEPLLQAAVEVGMDESAVVEAMAIERLPVVESPRRIDRLVGEKQVVVERRIDKPADRVLTVAEHWLAEAHRLRCDRRGNAIVCWKRDDLSASVARTIDGLRGEARLGAVHRLEVTAVTVASDHTSELDHTLLRLSADRTIPRRFVVGGGAALGAAGAGSAVLGVTGALALWPLITLPVLGLAAAVLRSGRSQSDRLELELERLLSKIERGERNQPLVGRLVRRARSALRSPSAG